MNKDSLELPPSVAAWLTDSATRMAVNALLEVDSGSLPPELRWDELRTYHAARAGAELFRSEWVIALHDAWQAVWGSQVPASWLIWSPSELLDSGEWITVESAFEEDSFTVRHERKGVLLFTLIEFAPDVTTIAFGLEPKVGEDFLVQGEVKTFEWRSSAKDEWGHWNVSRLPGNLASSPELLTELRRSAQEAIQFCETIAQRI